LPGVERTPLRRQDSERVAKHVQIDGLGEVQVKSRLVGAALIAFLPVARQRDQADRPAEGPMSAASSSRRL
jgi:hypothetical protein